MSYFITVYKFLFILTQCTRLYADRTPPIELNRKSYNLFLTIKQIDIPIINPNDPEAISKEDVIAVAYLDSLALKHGRFKFPKTLKLAGGSLRVMFFKRTAGFDHYRLRETLKDAKLIGALKINQDWMTGWLKSDKFFFKQDDNLELAWVKQLVSKSEPEKRYEQVGVGSARGKDITKPIQTSESIPYIVKELRLQFGGFSYKYGNPQEINVVYDTKFTFEFVIGLERYWHTQKIELIARDDGALLIALQEKWPEVCQSQKDQNRRNGAEGWWKSPYFYLIVIFAILLGLALAAYTFYNKRWAMRKNYKVTKYKLK